MKRIAPPWIGMSGVQLGFYLSELTHQLIETTHILTHVDPSDERLKGRDGERLRIASSANDQITTIRARLHRYVTLAVAKERPDADLLSEREDDFSEHNNLVSEGVRDKMSLTNIAHEIHQLCGKIIEELGNSNAELAKACYELDVKLEQHAALCSLRAAQLESKTRELDERDD